MNKHKPIASLIMLPSILAALGIPSSFIVGHVAGRTHPWAGPAVMGVVIIAQLMIIVMFIRQIKKSRAI